MWIIVALPLLKIPKYLIRLGAVGLLHLEDIELCLVLGPVGPGGGVQQQRHVDLEDLPRGGDHHQPTGHLVQAEGCQVILG